MLRPKITSLAVTEIINSLIVPLFERNGADIDLTPNSFVFSYFFLFPPSLLEFYCRANSKSFPDGETNLKLILNSRKLYAGPHQTNEINGCEGGTGRISGQFSSSYPVGYIVFLKSTKQVMSHMSH